jgi:hypothetical protein
MEVNKKLFRGENNENTSSLNNTLKKDDIT